MIKLYLIIVLFLAIYIFFHSSWFHSLKRMLGFQGLSFKKKELTMFDVRRLLIEGKKDSAVEVYRDLFKVSSQEAWKAVDEMERGIQRKDFEC